MPYGWRIIRAWFAGSVLAFAWWLFTWPPDLGHMSAAGKTCFAAGLYIAIFGTALVCWKAVFRVLPCKPPKGSPLRTLIFYGIWRGPTTVFLILCGFAFVANLDEFSGPQITARDQARLAGLVELALKTYVTYTLILFGPPLLVYWLEGIKENATLRRWFLGGRGGSARWAGPATYNRFAQRPDDGTGIYLGRTIFDDDFSPRHIVSRDDGHMLTIGQPGSGKSVVSIWPNLAMYRGSAIVVDPKGEHTKMFLGRRQDHSVYLQHASERSRTGGTGALNITKTASQLNNAAAFVLDPYGIVAHYESARYNVLSEIDIHDRHARTMISAVTVSSIPPVKGDNTFWVDTARLMLDGAIAHVLSKHPKEHHNLPYVADLLIGLDPATGFADPDKLQETFIEMRMNGAVGGLPQKAAATFDTLDERGYGYVTAELQIGLKWVSDPAMREHLSTSDFKFSDVGHDGRITTVFIAIPFGAMVEQGRWLRSVVELSMQALQRSRENRAKPSPPVLYVLDELPQYGKQLEAIKEGMVTLRDAGVKLWPFVQNLKQLVDCFGEEGAKNFESGATIQLYGVNDMSTAGWAAAKLGQHKTKEKKGWFIRKTVKTDETELIDAAAVAAELGKTDPIEYIFPCSGRPMRLERMAFKPVEIEGARLRGLSLTGMFDEHLLDSASSANQTTRILVKRPQSAQVEESKALFEESTSLLPPQAAADTAEAPSLRESWAIVSEWDATDPKPRVSEGRRFIDPALVAWRPDGSELVSACNGRTFTRWSPDGTRIAGNGEYTHGSANRFFWSPDGKYVLLEGRSSLNVWWTIQGSRGEVLAQMTSQGACGSGNISESTLTESGLERTGCCNPWRPGRRQFLVAATESRLDLFDAHTLPKPGWTSSDVKRMIASTVTGNSQGNRIPPVASLDFSRLDDQARCSMRYHWHPGGEFLAVTVCDPDDKNTTRHVCIIHFERGEIMTSVPSLSTGLGWSPDGKLYLYSRWDEPYTDNWKRNSAIWDSQLWACRELTKDEADLVWVRRLYNTDLEHSHEILNADGSRVLRYGKLMTSKAWGAHVDTASDGDVIMKMPHYEHAAWSPTDPHCFATVGGEGDLSRTVRVWRLNGISVELNT